MAIQHDKLVCYCSFNSYLKELETKLGATLVERTRSRVVITPLGEEVVEDYVATRLSLKAHPLALLRDVLTPPAVQSINR